MYDTKILNILQFLFNNLPFNSESIQNLFLKCQNESESVARGT